MLIDNRPEDEVPLPYKTVYKELQTNLGVVIKDDKVVLPRDLRGMFLQTIHGNHEGVGKMLEKAKLCWWPGMDKDIKEKARNCVRCIQNGKNLKTKLTPKDLGKLRTLTGPNQELQIDFYGPFRFQNKKKFLIVSIDRFTKWVNIKPVDFTGTKQVIKFLKQVFVDSGIPEVIKSDNATCFNSTEYLKFLKRRSIKPEYVTPYVHTGNGSVERTIGTIDAYFKIYLEETKNMQDSVLKMLELLRFTYHQSIKQTPFEKHYGRKPDTQLSVQFKNIQEILENPNAEITYLVTDLQKNTFGQFRYKARPHANHESLDEWTGTGNCSAKPTDLEPSVSVKYFLRKIIVKRI